MLRIKRLGIGFAVILALLLQCHLSSADIPQDYMMTKQGKIEVIDANNNILVVDDSSYLIGKDVVVKTASGKPGRVGMLYPGKYIRMDVMYSGLGGKTPVIHSIYILK